MATNTYSFVVAFAAGVGGLLFGYEIGVIGQVLSMTSFASYFGYKFLNDKGAWAECTPDNYPAACTGYAEDVTGWITFTFLIGCALGALLASMMADGLGRKWSILVGGFFFTLGSVFQCIATNVPFLYAGRLVAGFGVGIMSMSVPLYISETAPTAIRGRLITVYQLMITIGIFVASVINSIIILTAEGKGDIEWRAALGVQMIPGVILMIIMVFMPYSPRWLANRDRDTEAIAVLAKLRSLDVASAAVQEEYREIKSAVELERQVGTASWPELMRPGIINRVFLGIMLQFFQQWTGINVILYYQSNLFERMGIDERQARLTFPLASNFINFVATFPGMYLIERIGRRKLLLFGGVGMGLSHFSVCLWVGLSKTTPALAWLAIFSVYFFFFFFASTWGPVVWVYQSEIFPLRVRAKGTGVSTISNWSWNAVIAKITPKIIAKVDFLVYLIFGSTGMLMALFVYVFVPETMGKSLEEMDELFGSTGAKKSDVEFAAKQAN